MADLNDLASIKSFLGEGQKRVKKKKGKGICKFVSSKYLLITCVSPVAGE